MCLIQAVQGTGPNGRIIAGDVEKFIKEGGTKAKADVKKAKDAQVPPSEGARKERETAARTGGYDEQQVSQLKSVNILYYFSKLIFIFFILQENARRVSESKSTIPHYYLNIEVELDEILKYVQIVINHLFLF